MVVDGRRTRFGGEVWRVEAPPVDGLVLSVLPSNLARAVVALTIATGAAATSLGLVVFADVVDRPEEEPKVFP